MEIRIEMEGVNPETGKRDVCTGLVTVDDTMLRLVRDPFFVTMQGFEKSLREVFRRCGIDVPENAGETTP